jgi:hypothetical protein
MNDAFQAFLQFLVDLFSALSKFLGFDADFGDMFGVTTTTEAASDETTNA